MSKVNVAVLRGGPSRQYDASLQSGAAILQNLSPEKYTVHDILISRNGEWHRDGAPRSPARALVGIDVVVNALHGEYGEDGKVQRILESLAIPYTGSGPVAAAVTFNKALAKNSLQEHGIQTPYFTTIKASEHRPKKIEYIYQHFFLPLIVKPASGGGSVGVSIINDFADLEAAIEFAFQFSDTVLIEEYIRGREASVGVVENFRGKPVYSLLPIESVRVEGAMSNAGLGNIADSSEIVAPGNFSNTEKAELARLAASVHNLLGLRHYSHTDFVITSHRGIYVLEANALPSLAEGSPMMASLSTVGSNLPEFLDHLIETARA